MKKGNLAAPVVKWVGGKRQLLKDLAPLLPEKITTYCEPFVGGGAMLFYLQPKVAFINDINDELIRVYQVIKSDVEDLINTLSDYKNDADFFYKVRDWDRDETKYSSLSDIEKAARIIYLNKTCFNGLFRVNSSGEFNTPFGNYRNPNIINAPTLRAVSTYFNSNKLTLTSEDYSVVLENIPKGSFVYLDPPYDPISDTSSFTGYSKGGFTCDDQIRLRNCCDSLDRKGIKFMLSNSTTKLIRDQYEGYNISFVRAKRSINSDPSKRGEIDEIVVRNYV
jgi:DNA adenine methylase